MNICKNKICITTQRSIYMYCDGATVLKIYETVLKFISFKRNVRIFYNNLVILI